MMDQEKIRKGIRLLLEGIGEDPEREGLKETPDRIVRMYEEIYGGLTETAEVHLGKTFFVENDEMVLEKDITFYSTCEHHLLPFYGKAHIAYIPDGRVAADDAPVRPLLSVIHCRESESLSPNRPSCPLGYIR